MHLPESSMSEASTASLIGCGGRASWADTLAAAQEESDRAWQAAYGPDKSEDPGRSREPRATCTKAAGLMNYYVMLNYYVMVMN